MVALWIVVLFCFIALAIDLGMMAVTRNQCQEAADAAALSGARALNGTTSATNPSNFNGASTAARTTAGYNYIISQQINSTPGANQVQVQIGNYAYDASKPSPDGNGTGLFSTNIPGSNPAVSSMVADTTTPSATTYNAVSVTVNSAPRSYSFAQLFNLLPGVNMPTTYAMSASATAAHRPRDVAIAFDLSGSMGADTGWGQIFKYQYNQYARQPVGWMNDPIYPKFGHYSNAAFGNVIQNPYNANSVAGGNVDNLTRNLNDNSACIADFVQQTATSESVTPVAAFSSAGSTLTTATNGDTPPYTLGSTSSFATNVNDVTSNTPANFGNAAPYTNWKGYTQGPGYWGMTFFMWPPNVSSKTNNQAADTAAANFPPNIPPQSTATLDWRRRFFRTDPYSTSTRGAVNDNSKLFTAAGVWQAPGPSTYYIDYDEVLRWINTVTGNGTGMLNSTTVVPPQLRNGRIMYYSYVPNPTNPTSGQSINYNLSLIYQFAPSSWSNFEALTGTHSGLAPDGATPVTLSDRDCLNLRFWKEYIDYVMMVRQIGSDFTQQASWQGIANWTDNGYNNNDSTNSWGFQLLHGGQLTWGTPQITGGTWNDPSDTNFSKFAADNPQRPLLQFWFGPLSLADFVTNCCYFNNWPGNIHQAQMWIAKSGLYSALGSMSTQHPNDYVTLAMYAMAPCKSGGASGAAASITPQRFTRIRSPLGPNYQRLQGALWYPPAAMTSITDTTQWQNVSCYNATDCAEAPYARGLTHYTYALQLIYNQFSGNNIYSVGTDYDLYKYSTAPTNATNSAGTMAGTPLSGAVDGESGGGGRRGAQKIIIFESDGVPTVQSDVGSAIFVSSTNSTGYYKIRAGGGARQEYPAWADYEFITIPPPAATVSNIMTVVNQLCAAEAAGGFMVSARKPVMLYGLFYVSTESASGSASTLAQMQAASGVGGSSTTLAPYQVIDGTDAVTNQTLMETAFNKILNNGVQLTLIQ
jgi:hypothetical protein